jgi:hypothetical protein
MKAKHLNSNNLLQPIMERVIVPPTDNCEEQFVKTVRIGKHCFDALTIILYGFTASKGFC